MPSYGLQTFAPDGTTLRLNISDRTPRLITTVTAVPVPTGAGTTAVSVPGVSTTSTSTVVLTDSGATAQITATNTVTIYGTYDGGTTKLRVLEF